jgi:hypothetical protein
MDRSKRGPLPYLGVVGVVGAALVALGAGEPGPVATVTGLLPAPWPARVLLAGSGVLALAVLGTVLVVVLKLTVFLLSVVFRGREALASVEVDPLVSGMLAVSLLGAMVLGAGALVGPSSAGADLPYVDEAYSGGAHDADGVVADDELGGIGRSGADLPAYPDADGDRLPDSWERRGETPDGVPLPGADPDRKDLYVQVNYANGHPPLNRSERRQLRRIWAEMPVSNPDGSTGIDLHLVDEQPRAGRIDDRVVVGTDGFSESFVRAYYSDDYLGPRGCTHYLAVFGDVEGSFAGWGLTPGYLSVVDGGELRRVDGTTVRVRVLTHELLHNLVGQLSTGDTHTDGGWLASGGRPSDPSMSGTVRRDVDRDGFARSAVIESGLCDEPVGAAGTDGS